MKRALILGLVLVLALAMGLAACGGTEEETTTTAAAPATTATTAAPVTTATTGAPETTTTTVAAQEPVTLKYATTFQEMESGGKIIQHFCDYVEDKTAGAVKFASSVEELEQLKTEVENSSLSKDDLLEQRYGVRPGDPRELGPNLIHVNDENFAKEVLESPIPVVVDFWAEWCAPCRILAPTFKAMAAEYEGRMRFAKLDTEEASFTAARYGIMSIPTMLFFSGGRVVDQAVGALPAAALRQKIDRVLVRAAS